MQQLDLGTRMIVENVNTGERYTQATPAEWSTMLAAWKKDLERRDVLLARVDARARARGSWRLYSIAKKALYRRLLPCPMPWDHIMFEGAETSATYRRVR